MIIHQSNIKLFDAESMGANATSESININAFDLYAVQYIWSGYSTGTITVSTNASNNGTDWTPVDSFVVSNVTDNRMLNVEKAGYSYVNVSFEQTGGTGTITVIFNGKSEY